MKHLIAAIGLSALAAPALAQPPLTEERPVEDTLHGTVLVDEFRWLEGDNSDASNMGLINSEVGSWTDEQNAYTRRLLDAWPGRDALESRLRELMEVGGVGTPQMVGDRYFYSKREGTQAQSVIYVRDGLDAEPRVLLDPNALSEDGLLTVSWYTPSQDASLMAFGMYEAGDENSTLYVMDVSTGEWLAEEIPGKVGSVQWLPSNDGFFYRRLADLDDPYSAQFKFHRLGTHHRQDAILFEQHKMAELYEGLGKSDEELAALSKTWGPYGIVDDACRWLVTGYWTGTDSMDGWVSDLDHWFRAGELVFEPMSIGQRGRTSASAFVGDVMYATTFVDSPNGRVVKVDLHNPSMEHWVEVIPEKDGGVLQSASMARGMLAASYLEDASTRIELYDLDGGMIRELELPGIGSAGLSVNDDRTEAFLTFSSYNMPRSIFWTDLASGDMELWERPDVPVDPSIVEVSQVWYDSKDGTKVSMFIVAPKGTKLDGKNPTILYGYGGFNISMTPYFSSTMFPWYEAGGVYAVANLRGGGEYGQAWHEAGMLENKQNVFDDFIAAAEYLIDEGYTNPDQLGIMGGSNGGLLTGAVSVQRPDLFGAVYVGVPLLDMLRYQDFLMARYWVPEYGSAENPEQFDYLLAYSPYHNIEDGVEYPPMFITAGENDTRVHPMHARKFAAKVQASTSGAPSEKPVLLWVDREAGHGAGKSLDQRVRDVTDSRLFMMRHLGAIEE